MMGYGSGGGGSTPANVTYNTGGVIAQFTAANATDVPLVVKGAASQSADLYQVRLSDNSVVFKITSGGFLTTIGGTAVFGVGLRPAAGGPYITAANYTDLLIRDGSLGSAAVLQFGTADNGICRNAAGVVEINNGTAGTYRDLKLRNLIVTGTLGSATYTAATLPGAPVAGDRAVVTDANSTTFLAAVAGGGANKVPVFYDGSGWKIG